MIRLSADIEYLDGTLAGMTIPDGWHAVYPDGAEVIRAYRWADRTYRAGDFVRATGTGNRYRFTSAPRWDDFSTRRN